MLQVFIVVTCPQVYQNPRSTHLRWTVQMSNVENVCKNLYKQEEAGIFNKYFNLANRTLEKGNLHFPLSMGNFHRM